MKQNKLRKNLFKRYVTVATVFTLVCLVIFGLIATLSFSNFWISEQYDLLDRNSQSVSKQISAASQYGISNYSYLASVAAANGDAIGGYVFISDAKGQIVVSNLVDTASNGTVLSESLVNQALSGRFNKLTNLDGCLSKKCFFSASTIKSSDGSIMGIVFSGTGTSALTIYTVKLFRIYLIVSMVIILITVMGAYVISAQMVRPLREMGSVAKSMAAGNYSRRIKVDRRDEIGDLEEAFNEMADSVSRSEQTRRGFLANVSHELKTPLTTIAGFIDGILDGTIEPENQKKYLTIVSEEVRRMNALVMSMFNLSKLESGEMTLDLKPLRVPKTIVSVFVSFESKINSKNISIDGLDTLEDIYISADEGLFHQAIYNLADNAVKFTDNGGRISVSCTNIGENAVIKIRNTGEGIPPASLPRIFERFYKTDSSRGKDKTGAGLGLSLVKTVVDLHGGTITVRSVENQFTEFEIRVKAIESNGEKHE
ncbi:MAG: ATP-binding protein [Acutalibacteraceae bacterium]